MCIMQAASLSDFYEVCKGLELARNFQFPILREVIVKDIGYIMGYLFDGIARGSGNLI